MTNKITTANQTTAVQTVSADDYKAIATQWLTSTGNLKKFTENEKAQFIDICVAYGLNPIKKEVYGVKYGESNFNIIVGYEVYLKRAQRSGLLNGFNTTTEQVGDDIKAVCTIYRKDWEHPFVHEVYLSEYNTGKSLWQTKKITMIKKVAEAQAFRKCFPDELGGMPYTSDELPEEMTTDAPAANTAKLAEKAIKQAPNPELDQLTEILTKSMYANGDLVFTEADKKAARESIKTNGVKATLADIKEVLVLRVDEYAKKAATTTK